jgi:hypothetical protein
VTLALEVYDSDFRNCVFSDFEFWDLDFGSGDLELRGLGFRVLAFWFWIAEIGRSPGLGEPGFRGWGNRPAGFAGTAGPINLQAFFIRESKNPSRRACIGKNYP